MAKTKVAQYIMSERFHEDVRQALAEAVAKTRAASLPRQPGIRVSSSQKRRQSPASLCSSLLQNLRVRDPNMAKTTLAQYILSDQFTENARRGVAEAVAKTRAAGLIPAGDTRVKRTPKPREVIIIPAPTPIRKV